MRKKLHIKIPPLRGFNLTRDELTKIGLAIGLASLSAAVFFGRSQLLHHRQNVKPNDPS